MKEPTRILFQKARMIKKGPGYKAAIMNSKDLDSTCWSVQFWGVNYCKTCELLGTRDCGGSKEVKEYLRRTLCTVQR